MEDDSFDDDAQPWYEVDTRSTSKAVQDDVLLNGQIDIADLSRAELKANLKARGLEATGHKALLRERLQNAVKQRYLESAEHLARVEEERVAEVKLEESGSVYTVGANHQGQLGLGDREPRNLFQVIESLRGKHVDMVFAVGSPLSHAQVNVTSNLISGYGLLLRFDRKSGRLRLGRRRNGTAGH